MADLRPTPARLALLQAVAEGGVTEHYGIWQSDTSAVWAHGPAGTRRRTVTARADDLYRAGLIRLGDKIHAGYRSPRLFEITEAGYAVLAAAKETK